MPCFLSRWVVTCELAVASAYLHLRHIRARLSLSAYRSQRVRRVGVESRFMMTGNSNTATRQHGEQAKDTGLATAGQQEMSCSRRSDVMLCKGVLVSSVVSRTRARPFFRKFNKGYRKHGRRLGSLIKVPTSISPVEMRVKIDNSSKMLLTYKNAKVLQKAENIVAVVERYLQTSFAVLRAAVCCVCNLLRCQRTAVPH